MTWLEDVPDEALKEKSVLCRVDFNVPLDDACEVADGTKIELTLPTIRRLIRASAKVIIVSHLGRPKGKFKKELTLEPVAHYLRDMLNTEVTFVHDCVGDGVLKIVREAKPGSVTFLENTRFNAGEEKDDPVFAKMLARGADVFVNDAFATVHRAHASVHGVAAHLPMRFGGYLLKKEIDALGRLVKNPKAPFVAAVGGAKVSSKIGVLVKLLSKVQTLIIGGAMAYTFLKALGQNVGSSLVEDDKLAMALSLLKKAEELQVKVLLPVDHVVASSPDASDVRVVSATNMAGDMTAFDIGPETIKLFSQEIAKAQTIFMNGPVGLWEKSQFAAGTNAILSAIAHNPGFSVVGGGDTIAALNQTGLAKEIGFVSTGGGAALEFLEGKRLPGLAALEYYS